MLGCVVNDDGTVNYYLKSDDWSKKSNGDASDLSGAAGQVMVQIPTFYYYSFLNGNTYEYRMSLYPLTNYTMVYTHFVGAYEAAYNTSGTVKLWSIVNTATEYRGGNRSTAQMDGCPATLVSRTNFRTYADNRGTKWTLHTGEQYSALVWLFMVEYATRNSQAAVNYTLTAEGYKQGGLGNGVTTSSDANWSAFNGYYPFIKCGSSNAASGSYPGGNGTGEVSVAVAGYTVAADGSPFMVNRYRGVENPFGHIWKWLDGINIDHVHNTSSTIWQRNTKTFVDNTSANYTNAGQAALADGYVKLMQDGGLIIPKTVGGDAATWFCDYYYVSGVTGWDAPIVGGYAINEAYAGFGYFAAYFGASDSTPNLGARLCAFGT
jgi:hypothetical protein